MKAAFAVLGLLCGTGCVRVSEGTVRDKAAADFACADYALTIVEVGPDVFRASGCGQEIIYACQAIRAPARDARDAQEPSGEPVMVCARTPE